MKSIDFVRPIASGLCCLCRLHLGIVVVGLLGVLAAPGCENRPATSAAAEIDVESLLRAYAKGTTAEKEAAQETIRKLGDSVVDALDKCYRPDNQYNLYAAEALTDVGTEKAFRVLVGRFGDDDARVQRAAAAFVRVFVQKNQWSSERACKVEGLADAACDYLNRDRGSSAIRTVVMLDLQRAVPALKRLLEEGDSDIRAEAARAIRAISGEAVEVDRTSERFTDRKLNDALLARVFEATIKGDTIRIARLAPAKHGCPRVIAAVDQDDRTKIVEIVPDGSQRDIFTLDASVEQFHILPTTDSSKLWMLCIASKGFGSGNRIIAAVDAQGNVQWTWQPGGLYGRHSVASWQFAASGEPDGILVNGTIDDASTLLNLDLAGKEQWRIADAVQYGYATHPCVPQYMLGCWASMGTAYLRDTKGALVAKFDRIQSGAEASDAILVARGEDEPVIAISEKRDGTRQLALSDLSFRTTWECNLATRPTFECTLGVGHQADSYIFVVDGDGVASVVDMNGVLCYQQSVIETDPHEHGLLRGTSWRDIRPGGATWILLCGQHRVALLSFGAEQEDALSTEE